MAVRRLSPYYCEDNGRLGVDPVVLIKVAILEHLYGLSSLQKIRRDIKINVAYRWFQGYNLLEKSLHSATVSDAFCRRNRAFCSVPLCTISDIL